MQRTDTIGPIGGLYEKEPARLQREADAQTKKLEHEKKNYLLKEDFRKNQQEVLDQIHHRISEKIPDKVFEHRKEVKRLSLLHKLAHKKVMLNDTIGRNSALKVNIDIMRKEIIFAQDSINDMKVEIEALSQGARAAHKISCVAGTIADETNNEILATKARREKNNVQVQAAAMALEN